MNTITNAREVDVDAETYHSWLHVTGNSTKERFHRNRREYKEVHVDKTRPPSPPTDDMRTGIYTHLALWEPELWAGYTSLPRVASDGEKFDLRKKLHKAEYAELQAMYPKALDHDQWTLVEKLKRALWESPVARKLLDRGGLTERSILWTDPESGIECKSRQDRMFTLGDDVIVDLKTTAYGVSRNSLRKTIQNGGLHRNADFYIRGHHELTGNVPHYVFLFVSKLTFQCAACDLTEEWISLGHRENQAILNEMARCYETGDWFESHEKEIMTLDPPRYAFTNPDVEID